MVSEPLSPAADVTATRGSYLVVARRYRPQTFADLVGQQHVVRGLTRAIETDRVGHAYLFTGARGVGKTSAARIFAKALNCQTGISTSPCGTCDICQGIVGGDDVDVLEIDGASNRGIDEIRQLRQNVAIRPSRARFKIYIIDEVHMLTRDAFNALLKTLEEPPQHVKFFFATTEPNKIPLTILSRCQRFDFAGIETSQIGRRLQQIVEAEGIAAEADAIELLALRGAGSMRDSQSLLEQLLAIGQKAITVDDVTSLLGIAPAARLSALVHCLAAGQAADALAELDAALAEGIDTGPLLDQLLGCFRDMMAAAIGCPAQRFLYTARSQADEVARLGAEIGVDKVLAILQILQQAITRFRTMLHSRTLAEVAIVRICNLDEMDQLPALIAELRAAADPLATSDQAGRARAGQVSTRPVVPAKNEAHGPAPPRGDTSAPPAANASSAARPEPGSGTESKTHALTDTWARPLALLTARSELVADQAALCSELTTTAAGHVVVSFLDKYTACKTFCEQPQQRAKLEEALAAVTGGPVRLEIRLVESPTKDPHAGPAPGPSRRQLHAEVGMRPFVRRAMELFDTGHPKVEPPSA